MAPALAHVLAAGYSSSLVTFPDGLRPPLNFMAWCCFAISRFMLRIRKLVCRNSSSVTPMSTCHTQRARERTVSEPRTPEATTTTPRIATRTLASQYHIGKQVDCIPNGGTVRDRDGTCCQGGAKLRATAKTERGATTADSRS